MSEDWAETRTAWHRLKASWHRLWREIQLSRADRHLGKAVDIYLKCNSVEPAMHVIAAMSASLKDKGA